MYKKHFSLIYDIYDMFVYDIDVLSVSIFTDLSLYHRTNMPYRGATCVHKVRLTLTQCIHWEKYKIDISLSRNIFLKLSVNLV